MFAAEDSGCRKTSEQTEGNELWLAEGIPVREMAFVARHKGSVAGDGGSSRSSAT